MEVMNWEDRIDGVSKATAEDLNTIAKELISTQNAVTKLENKEETKKTLVINTQEEWDEYFVNGKIINANPLYIIVNCGIQLSGNLRMPSYMTHLMLDFRNNGIFSETPVVFDGTWDFNMAQRGTVIKNARFVNVSPQYFKKMECCIMESDVFSSDNLHNCEIRGTAYGCTGIIGGTAKGLNSCKTVLLNSYDGVTIEYCTNVIGGTT